MRRLHAALLTLAVVAPAAGQTTPPFPHMAPNAAAGQQAARPQPPPSVPPVPGGRAAAPGPGQTPAPGAQPTADAAFFPIYPAAQFIASYDAGRGQRYLVYGTTAPYVELVAYYRSQLKERGTAVFEEPPTHMFEVGRFRAETMAFPPGVTIKDWTWGGSRGYPNPKPGAEPAHFPTIIMIVPPPPGAP
jgi:hypothetical protein